MILDLLANDPTRRELTGSTFSREDFLAAKEEELEIVPQGQPAWKAPHFVWYVREELRERLCGDAETCDTLEQGGLRVVEHAGHRRPGVGREVDPGGDPGAPPCGPGRGRPGAGRLL